MTPVRFEGHNLVLGQPAGWDAATHGPCAGLPVRRQRDGDSAGYLYTSVWTPSWRERLALLFGAGVALTVMQRGHPPVALAVAPYTRAAEQPA